MSLTGPVFFALALLGTAAAFAATVLLLPRVSARRPRPVLARVSMLLVVNLLVLFTAAVALNDQFSFFADWTDLRGTFFGGPVGVTAHAGAGAAQAAGVVIKPPSAPATSPALAAISPVLPGLPPGASSTDRVLRYTVTGAASGLSGTVLVTLPEGYTLPANQSRRYPVLETFPGYPGDPSEWIDSMNLGSALDQAVAQHTLGPVITISPTTEFPPGVDTECVDGPGGFPKVETWLTQDVPNWVMRTLRVRTDRASWATIGLSTGGWCAAMATMLHPNQYAAGIVMGGYYQPQFSSNYVPFRPNSAEAQRYNLVALARHRPPPVALWLETSHSDPVSYPSTARLLAAAHAPLSIQALVLTHAGHRTSLWSSELPQVFTWLGRYIPGFAP